MRLIALAALLLLLAAAAPAAASFDVCETYSKEECLDHADTCVLCKAWGRVDVCFEAAIAQKLPSKLFTCDFPAPPPPSPSDPGLGTDCQSFKTEDACSQGGCVWCVSAAVPSSCYTEEEAKRLPAAVFQCKLPSLAEA